MPRCSLWELVGLLVASKRPVQAAAPRVRKVAVDRQAVGDGLLCHRPPPETAEQKPPTPKRRAQPPQEKS